MNKKTLLLGFACIPCLTAFSQNPLAIPSTLSGSNIALTLQEGTTDFYPGITTNTMGANGDLLGPTLILDKGDFVSISVNNQLPDTTTIHWHGMHIAPENDGGPHNIILPGTTWNPQFTVMDKAGMYWYHPHLHMQTDKHVSKGIAGAIIVRDSEEASLNIPQSYGIDEFPVIIQTKGFDALGQIEVHTQMDTSVMVNGTIDAILDLPAQIVRLRVLNGSNQRVFEIGFSDNRSFSLIGTDGGLLTGPVNLTRYRMAPGQRADILVDLNTSLGQNFQLMNYGSELPIAIYGAAQPGMGAGSTIAGYDSNPLNGSDFQLLDINVATQTASPVTVIPASLAIFSLIPEASATITRDLGFSSTQGMGDIEGPFVINGTAFDMNVINYNVPLDNIEVWSLTNQTGIAHPFHIHDVQFFILEINGMTPPPELQGYNDVVLVPAGMGNVRFITQFSDFANDTLPYMYHCHSLTHEDMGMMGQFLVKDPFSGLDENNLNSNSVFVYPNPLQNETLTINASQFGEKIIGYEFFNLSGESIESSQFSEATNYFMVDVNFSTGVYLLQLISENQIITKRIVIN